VNYLKTILKRFPVWDTLFVGGVGLIGWGLFRWSHEGGLIYSGFVLVMAACILRGGAKVNDR